MKRLIKRGIGLLLFIMLITNVYIYTQTIVLGDHIVRMESDIKALKLENGDLEKKIASFNSLHNLHSVAGELGFTQKAQPIYFGNFHYALATENE